MQSASEQLQNVPQPSPQIFNPSVSEPNQPFSQPPYDQMQNIPGAAQSQTFNPASSEPCCHQPGQSQTMPQTMLQSSNLPMGSGLGQQSQFFPQPSYVGQQNIAQPSPQSSYGRPGYGSPVIHRTVVRYSLKNKKWRSVH
ncbi:hypothetical protein RB195_004216 [Necator americanus]|uniref:Uncharacterized protein n=1 Tax=Necator americanus TaxID=51031 RepID=A0ABR1BGW6_NECAM